MDVLSASLNGRPQEISPKGRQESSGDDFLAAFDFFNSKHNPFGQDDVVRDGKTYHFTRAKPASIEGQFGVSEASWGCEVDLSNVKLKPIWELSDGEFQAFVEERVLSIKSSMDSLGVKYATARGSFDLSKVPITKDFASVVVRGQVVATFDNQGNMITFDDDLAARLGSVGDSWAGSPGPERAQRAASFLAASTGGRVVKAPTAMAQWEFDALPTYTITTAIDVAALRQDPDYALLQEMRGGLATALKSRAEYLGINPTTIPDFELISNPAAFELPFNSISFSERTVSDSGDFSRLRLDGQLTSLQSKRSALAQVLGLKLVLLPFENREVNPLEFFTDTAFQYLSF